LVTAPKQKSPAPLSRRRAVLSGPAKAGPYVFVLFDLLRGLRA
jgi:hypothetical protein